MIFVCDPYGLQQPQAQAGGGRGLTQPSPLPPRAGKQQLVPKALPDQGELPAQPGSLQTTLTHFALYGLK